MSAKLPKLKYIKPGDENKRINRMRMVSQADDYLTNQQRSYMKEWNEHYWNKNINKPAVRNKKLLIGGTFCGLVVGTYWLALNKFKIRNDDLYAEMDKQAMENNVRAAKAEGMKF